MLFGFKETLKNYWVDAISTMRVWHNKSKAC